jgi:transcriptional regulator with XRE-family HTH domain
MDHAVKKTRATASIVDAPIDISRARLVRRGPAAGVSLSLRSLREAAGLTQAQVSKKSGLAQPEISKLEAATSLDDRMVATLRRYLAALGDELEIVSVSKLGHRMGVAAAYEERGAAPARAVEPPENLWQEVFGRVARLRASRIGKTSPADQHAWTLIVAGLTRFGAPFDLDGEITDRARERAYRALRGGSKQRTSLDAKRYVDTALDGLEKAKAAFGEGFAGYDETARLMCIAYGRSEKDAPELANMLANVIERTKSGRLPQGKATRSRIVQWLTGEKWGATVRRVLRPSKK